MCEISIFQFFISLSLSLAALFPFVVGQTDYGKCSHSRKKRKETKGGEGMVSWVYERVPGHQLALLPDSVTTGDHPSHPSHPSSSPSSFYPESSSSAASSVPPPPLSDFASGSGWSPGLMPESHPSSSHASFDSSLPPDPTSINDYTTARNNFLKLQQPPPQQRDHQVLQEEQERMKQHKKVNNNMSNSGNKKKRTRLSSPDQKVQEIRASSLLRCAEACLQENSFPCLSANFQRVRSLLHSYSVVSFFPVPSSICHFTLQKCTSFLHHTGKRGKQSSLPATLIDCTRKIVI